MKTAYYSAKVPIWIDEILDAEAWKTEFLKPDAQEVVEVVGAWIYCFRKSENKDTQEDVKAALQAIQAVTEEHVGYAADMAMLAVAVPTGKAIATSSSPDHADWEDICLEYGFEYIDYAGQGMNEFREKTGFERLKEALEANEWAATEGGEGDFDIDTLDLEGHDDSTGFALDEAEMTAELFGIKAALANEDPDIEDTIPLSEQADQVDNLDRLLGRLLAVKENSADLPEPQRKRMAAQAVKDLLREDAIP